LKPRVGLFFCRCGPNLGEVVELERLAQPGLWPEAAVVELHPVLCSEEGRAWLADRIRAEGLERVVVAACSPREHEATFQAVLSGAGLNPFLLQMANLREQCEWAGGPRAPATAKAAHMVRAALARAPHLAPLETSEIDCSPDVLVIGSGVAGLSATLTLLQKGRRVLLVEREHALGGRVELLDEVYPGMECASCFLEPPIDKVLHDPRVRVVTGAEVREVLGSFGDFRVTVHRRARRVDPETCLGCGSCAEACPVEGPDPFNGSLASRKAIYLPFVGCLPHTSAVDDALCLRAKGQECAACAEVCPFGAVRLDDVEEDLEFRCGAIVIATGFAGGRFPAPPEAGLFSCYQFERLLHPNGPTSGKPLLSDGRPPRSVLFALTPEGRGDGPLGWIELLKLGERLRHVAPEIPMAFAGGPARPLGPGADLTASLSAAGARFLPGALTWVEKTSGPLHGLTARLEDGEAAETLEADLLVVYEASEPQEGARELAGLLHLRPRPDGFFEDKAGPFETAFSGIEGIYVAGGAGGPRTIAAAIQDGAAAAARILSRLVPGEKLTLECLVSEVDGDRCGRCGVCAACCPYGAVHRGPDGGASRVEPALCRGCGTCAAACPSGAITAHHFTSRQILVELGGLLVSDTLPEGGCNGPDPR